MQPLVQRSESVTSAGLTEVVLAQDSAAQFAMLIPMLAHMSRNSSSRWITWVAPQQLDKNLLETYGFQLDKLRLIHTRDEQETLWVLWQALAQGNSDMVVASPGRLAERELASLEQAAGMGNCQGLLIRYR